MAGSKPLSKRRNLIRRVMFGIAKWRRRRNARKEFFTREYIEKSMEKEVSKLILVLITRTTEIEERGKQHARQVLEEFQPQYLNAKYAIYKKLSHMAAAQAAVAVGVPAKNRPAVFDYARGVEDIRRSTDEGMPPVYGNIPTIALQRELILKIGDGPAARFGDEYKRIFYAAKRILDIYVVERWDESRFTQVGLREVARKDREKTQ